MSDAALGNEGIEIGENVMQEGNITRLLSLKVAVKKHLSDDDLCRQGEKWFEKERKMRGL